MKSRVGSLVFLLLLSGSASATEFPPLPFARVQDIPTEGAQYRMSACPGEQGFGLIIVTAGGTYQTILHVTRAIIVDNRPGDHLPVWFVHVGRDRAFVLDMVMSFADAIRRYPNPCDYLVPPTASLRV